MITSPHKGVAKGLCRVLIKGVLGFIQGVLTLVHPSISSASLYNYLSLRLSVCLCTYQRVCLSIFPHFYPSIYLSCPSVCLCILLVDSPIYLIVFLSICMFARLSLIYLWYLSICSARNFPASLKNRLFLPFSVSPNSYP